ncbi:Stp1/IreP family PP2C-type Ser/Thr phosphatase [Dethiothermospora halolimnae]|uniref:Stp1/IreP family PP2C-type Ser/Thr phosphatase n=1 Tax=Dethiothermospora halolimnae TaxID=3114390 RepID=UPI003CCC0A55
MLVGICTDVGKIRNINQDSFFYSKIKELPLFVVADGMGGHKAGEVASKIAIETIEEILYNNEEKLKNNELQIPKFIDYALKEANRRVFLKSQDENYRGMGTTVTLAFVFGSEVFIGHIGDSRAYLLRDKELIQLTRDHSLVAELVRNGRISEEEAMNHPQKNIITRALGTDENIKIDITSHGINQKDIILLCTDGLTNMVSNDRIKEIILSSKDVNSSCDLLINTANDLGGIDNITALLVDIGLEER